MKTINCSGNNGLRIRGILEDKVLVGPASAIFHITDLCNLRCLYCWHHSALRNGPAGRKGPEINFSVFKKLVDDCIDLRVEYIHLSAKGEPTLHSCIIGMLRYLKKRRTAVYLYTNGTFNSDILGEMRHVEEININLSAADARAYRSLQSLGSEDLFEVVISNIHRLCSFRKRRGARPRIRLHYVLNSMNYKHIASMFMLAHELKVDYLNVVDADVEGVEILSLAEKKSEINDILHSLKDKTCFLNVKSNILSNYRKTGGFMEATSRSSVRPEHCYMGWYSIFIDANGNVSPLRCGAKKRLICGNIYTQSLKNIWNSKSAHFIRLKGKYGCYGGKLPECLNCCEFQWNAEITRLIGGLEK